MFLGEDSRVRIDISLTDGKPEICLYDADGMTTRAEMTIEDDIATIRVCGAGLSQMALAARPDIVAVVATKEDGEPRAILSSSADPCLVLLDADGKPVFTAPPDGDSARGDEPDWKSVFGV